MHFLWMLFYSLMYSSIIFLLAETAPRSQRSTVSRRLNHDYLEEDEMDEYGQQDNEQYTNLEVTDALKNALQICKCCLTLLLIRISHEGLLH